ncbi:MAG: hypothetical protein HKP27_01275 [Myxococcales bacterium]|nr:hypothetical protein [Myxococcales bacterium]
MDYSLAGLCDPSLELGVEHGAALVRFVDALLSPGEEALAEARRSLAAALGPDAVCAASLVAANFSKNDRIANALGIPLEAQFVRDSEDFREQLGINAFRSARNTLKT